MMPRDTKPQLHTLAGLCRRLTKARELVAELEEQRDALIQALRADGVPGSALADCTGLSAGRVTQIAQSENGSRASKGRVVRKSARKR
jgi:hypothetical protein